MEETQHLGRRFEARLKRVDEQGLESETGTRERIDVTVDGQWFESHYPAEHTPPLTEAQALELAIGTYNSQET